MTLPHVRLRRATAALTLFACLAIPGAPRLFAVHPASAAPLPPPGADEDAALTQAKALYASASYDEALAILDRLTPSSKADKTGVAEYRVFCLLALGRREDANRAIEGILREDPFYRPSTSQASPRIQATINDVRKQVLPEIVLSSYADAKEAFDRKDPAAAQQFDRLLSLLEDPDAKSVAALHDLRTVVAGFRDLSKALVTPPVTAAPAAASSASSAPSGGTPASSASAATSGSTAPSSNAAASAVVTSGGRTIGVPAAPVAASPGLKAAPKPEPSKTVYDASDTDVVAPVAVTQRLPPWRPPPTYAASEYKGLLQIVIDEEGNVTSASMRVPAHPLYDSDLMQQAKRWKFKPAIKQGKPVSYLKVIDVVLRPRSE
jgi:hypothetical protein